MTQTGVLLTNIGTPDQPTPTAVRCYLSQFLSDSRVVEIPKIFWWPILHGIILRTRPRYAAALYQKIWTSEGSPLLTNMQKIARALQNHLGDTFHVQLGMHYSHPSIAEGLTDLQQKKVDKIIILPLYPQYSATTTAATFDLAAKTFQRWRQLPEIHFFNQYANHPAYIAAITTTIQHYWQTHHKPQQLLFSFHGIPKRSIAAGDPYANQCQLTVHAIAQQLQLQAHEWSWSFQSRLGRAEWLQPYTDVVLKSLPAKGITDIQVVCPGFAVDCLETLEEIALRGQECFLRAGGKKFAYIPALNASDSHIQALLQLIHNASTSE